MTSFIPQPIAGHIVPGTSKPEIDVLKPWGWQQYTVRRGVISEQPYGPPIKKEAVAQPTVAAPETGKPKAIGDEAHHGIMSALSSMVAQHATQMTDAMPSQRLWR